MPQRRIGPDRIHEPVKRRELRGMLLLVARTKINRLQHGGKKRERPILLRAGQLPQAPFRARDVGGPFFIETE